MILKTWLGLCSPHGQIARGVRPHKAASQETRTLCQWEIQNAHHRRVRVIWTFIQAVAINFVMDVICFLTSGDYPRHLSVINVHWVISLWGQESCSGLSFSMSSLTAQIWTKRNRPLPCAITMAMGISPFSVPHIFPAMPCWIRLLVTFLFVARAFVWDKPHSERKSFN